MACTTVHRACNTSETSSSNLCSEEQSIHIHQYRVQTPGYPDPPLYQWYHDAWSTYSSTPAPAPTLMCLCIPTLCSDTLLHGVQFIFIVATVFYIKRMNLLLLSITYITFYMSMMHLQCRRGCRYRLVQTCSMKLWTLTTKIELQSNPTLCW